MRNIDLDEFIRQERERPLPDCPSRLSDDVLRRVRNEGRPASGFSILDWLFGVVPDPRVTASIFAAAMALTFLLSAGTSLTLSKQSAQSFHSQQQATSALDFGFFRDPQVFHFDP